jgi:hypothetical protein
MDSSESIPGRAIGPIRPVQDRRKDAQIRSRLAEVELEMTVESSTIAF